MLIKLYYLGTLAYLPQQQMQKVSVFHSTAISGWSAKPSIISAGKDSYSKASESFQRKLK
jgi:hypothetical protein